MPTYEPDKWNKPENLPLNNCYNYATDNRNEREPAKPPPRPAVPGHAAGIEPGLHVKTHLVPLGPGRIRLIHVWKITCDSIAIACGADGLDEWTVKCEEPCWKVAYYWLPQGTYRVPYNSADFHFVRQDDDDKWSHKPNKGSSPVTRQQYNPRTKKFDGDEITDPSKAQMFPGYIFCDYLCCCPGTSVAMADPPPVSEGEAYVLADIDETPGRGPTMSLNTEVGFMDQKIGQIAAAIRLPWIDRDLDESPRIRLDFGPNAEGTWDTMTIYQNGFTVWRGFAQSMHDPKGIALATMQHILLGQAGPRSHFPPLSTLSVAGTLTVDPSLLTGRAFIEPIDARAEEEKGGGEPEEGEE